MAVTYSVPAAQEDVWGRFRVRLATVTFDSSYASGGEPVTPHDFNLSEIYMIIPMPQKSGYVVQPTADNSKLVVYYSDNNNASDGVLIEPGAIDLSALVVNVLVIGI